MELREQEVKQTIEIKMHRETNLYYVFPITWGRSFAVNLLIIGRN